MPDKWFYDVVLIGLAVIAGGNAVLNFAREREEFEFEQRTDSWDAWVLASRAERRGRARLFGGLTICITFVMIAWAIFDLTH